MYLRNIKIKAKAINHHRLWIDSMIGMTIGFLATLVVGTIIGLLGINQDNSWSKLINNIKGTLSYITPFGIGIGIGYKLKLKPYQILATAICAQILAQSQMVPKLVNDSINWSGNIGISLAKTPGDVFSAWVGSVIFVYIIKIFIWHDFSIAIIVIPLIGALIGIILSLSLTYLTSTILVLMQLLIQKTVSKNYAVAIILSPIIGGLMGLALSLPTSSVAISVALNLQGYAATAAIAGTAAQMISFGIMTYISNKSISKGLTVGFGSSMLQMKNFTRKPILLLIPTLASAVAAFFGVAFASLSFSDAPISVTPGMGTCGLYGQIYTLYENGFSELKPWMNVIFIQLLIPTILTVAIYPIFIKKKWILEDYLKI